MLNPPKPTTSTINTTVSLDNDNDIHIPPCSVEVSRNPFLDAESITLETRGTKHPTQGLLLENSPDWKNRVFIHRQIHGWMKRIKRSLLLSINDTPIHSVKQATTILNPITITKMKQFKIKVPPDKTLVLHHEFLSSTLISLVQFCLIYIPSSIHYQTPNLIHLTPIMNNNQYLPPRKQQCQKPTS